MMNTCLLFAQRVECVERGLEPLGQLLEAHFGAAGQFFNRPSKFFTIQVGLLGARRGCGGGLVGVAVRELLSRPGEAVVVLSAVVELLEHQDFKHP